MTTIKCWLVIKNGADVRVVKTRPLLAPNEVALEVIINAPSPPRIVGSVTVDLPAPPPAHATVEVVEYPDEPGDAA